MLGGYRSTAIHQPPAGWELGITPASEPRVVVAPFPWHVRDDVPACAPGHNFWDLDQERQDPIIAEKRGRSWASWRVSLTRCVPSGLPAKARAAACAFPFRPCTAVLLPTQLWHGELVGEPRFTESWGLDPHKKSRRFRLSTML
jgi:hypothetical protein